jgi:hypothetical protein
MQTIYADGIANIAFHDGVEKWLGETEQVG